MVGDPARVEAVLARFSKVRFRTQHREYVVATGLYKGTEISVFATGMGQDTTEIAVIECCRVTENPVFIRCGSSGALQKGIALGDLVITRGSLRLEGTTKYYVEDGYPAVADTDVVTALAAAARKLRAPFHAGLTASMPGFYGPQGREVEGFPIRFRDLPDTLSRQGVANFEMETATLLTLASLRGVRAGAVCAVFGNRSKDAFLPEAGRKKAESLCIDVALEAFRALRLMDAERKRSGTPLWVPGQIVKRL
jgi:uridine phosphorylase